MRDYILNNVFNLVFVSRIGVDCLFFCIFVFWLC